MTGMEAMRRTAYNHAPARRKTRPGGAMVEFLLMIPILLFIMALGGYMALGMRTKQDTLVRSRYDLWRNINQWWHDWDDAVAYWSDWDPTASGPIGTPVDTSNRPRGSGEALEYLYKEAGDDAYGMTDNAQAQAFFRTIWNNLPGRHVVRRGRTLEAAEIVRFLSSEIRGRHQMDSSTWPIAHLRLWYFAQYGPMQEINGIFHDELADVPDEFKRVRDEVLHNWFSEEWLPNWNDPNAVLPQ